MINHHHVVTRHSSLNELLHSVVAYCAVGQFIQFRIQTVMIRVRMNFEFCLTFQLKFNSSDLF